jgi:phospholipid transport system transporter-binding protein
MLLLPATVTIAEARDTLRMLAQAVPQEPDAEVSLDASGLTRFDTSALAVLLECHRLAQAGGRAFRLLRAPAKLLDLAALYGVDTLLWPADLPPQAGQVGAGR